MGSVGDVYPYLGIGRALRQRGHDVVVLANDYYAPAIEAVGLEHGSIGPAEEQEALLSDPMAWHRRRGWRVWLRRGARLPMQRIYAAVEARYVRGTTVVAGSWGGLGARVAHDHLGVPMATLHLEPDKFQSVHQTSPMPAPFLHAAWLPHWYKRFEFRMVNAWEIDRVVVPRLNAFRAELGLPPVRNIAASWWHAPQKTLALFPAWWAAPQPDWPAQAVVTGFPLWDAAATDASEDALAFAAAGPPPVVICPGVINYQARHFYAAAVAACASLGLRAVAIAKRRELLPEELPPGVRHFRYVPFSALLPRAAAVVHHAGIGTAAQALACGTPQLVTPPMHFHRDTAARLRGLGVGSSVAPARFRERAVARALDRLITSPSVKRAAREVAARVDTTGAMQQICRELESLIGADVTAGPGGVHDGSPPPTRRPQLEGSTHS